MLCALNFESIWKKRNDWVHTEGLSAISGLPKTESGIFLPPSEPALGINTL